MLLEDERKLIVKYGRKLIESKLTTGTGGNISIFNPLEKLFAIKPSGVPYFDITAEDVVVMDLEGRVVDGKFKPSSEFMMHKIFYERREDVKSVVHTHSVYATTLACLNWQLPAVHYLIALAGGSVPLAKYATYGTPDLAENAYNAMGRYNAVLLSNHGLLTVGENIESAFNTAEEIEFTCRIYYLSKVVGNPIILSEEEITRVTKKMESYGQEESKK